MPRIRKPTPSSDREPTPDPLFSFILIVLLVIFPLWYMLVGMAMTLMKDSPFIRQSSDLVQLIIIIMVWLSITGLIMWLASGVLNLLTRKNRD